MKKSTKILILICALVLVSALVIGDVMYFGLRAPKSISDIGGFKREKIVKAEIWNGNTGTAFAYDEKENIEKVLKTVDCTYKFEEKSEPRNGFHYVVVIYTQNSEYRFIIRDKNTLEYNECIYKTVSENIDIGFFDAVDWNSGDEIRL